jgi:alanine racemase
MRSFSGKNVYINNKKYKIVGKIAMDNMSVLVDKNVKIGDDVLIIKNFKHACEFIDDPSDLGNIIAVIAILSTFRVPRIPIKN